MFGWLIVWVLNDARFKKHKYKFTAVHVKSKIKESQTEILCNFPQANSGGVSHVSMLASQLLGDQMFWFGETFWH